jgi:hypothetical protein
MNRPLVARPQFGGHLHQDLYGMKTGERFLQVGVSHASNWGASKAVDSDVTVAEYPKERARRSASSST